MKAISILLLTLSLSLGYAMYKVTTVDRLVEPNNIIYPNVDSTYLVKILRPGNFAKSHINYDANTMEWFALVSNGVKYEVREMKVDMKEIKDDNGAKFQISGSDSLNNILFMSGVELIPKEVEEMKLGRRELAPGDRLELDYNKKKYVLTAEGQESKLRVAQGKPAQIVIEDYKIYIAEGSKEKNKTLLVHLKRLGEFTPKLLFMGDMDNDKKPDLIMETQERKGKYYYALFLSNHPKKGSMYKLESVFGYWE